MPRMEQPITPRKRAPGAGRKPLSDTGQKTIRARVTPEQYETWEAMPNASQWLRGQLDAIRAAEPGEKA
ncbi:hypothetical protein A4F85_04695 [Delftia sp. GW456-R20]|nr:hypothetical protein A4F85_04695 [Delftia sp. GW456-R20]